MTASSGRRNHAPPELFFISSALSLYVGASLAVTLFDRMPPGAVAFVRVCAAAVILLGWRRPWRRTWSRAERRAAALFGSTTAAMNLSFYLAADRIDLGASVAIEFIGPVVVAAIGTRTRRNIVALALAATGIVVMSTFATGAERAGIGFAIAAGAFWGAYIVFGRRVAVAGSGIDGLGAGLAVGALVIAPFGVGGLAPIVDEPWLLAAGACVGLLSGAIPYSLDQIVMTRIPRERFALLLALLPATATLVGLVLLGQVPSARELLGIALIVTAISVRDRTGERTPVLDPPPS